ncbi:MAG: MFS transporter [Bacteroidales bacterium 36-12]|nr:MAG: MFS transporter [Bacteroidales bacterium 36-12]
MTWTKAQISILIIVAVISFIGTFLISSINIAIPSIEKTFNLDAIALSWVITAYLLSSAIFLLPVGRIGDIIGIRNVFKIGIVIFTISSLLSGIAFSGSLLITFRFIQGIGAALTNTTGSAILVSAFVPEHRGRVLGVSVSATYLGLSLGPFLGGILTQYLGWQSIFIISFILGVFSTIAAFKYLKKEKLKTITFRQFDWQGTLLFMLGLVLLVIGSTKIPSIIGWISICSGILLLIIFWLFENKIQIPIFETKLFAKNKLFAYSNIAALINYSATSAIVFLLSIYLQKTQGLSPKEAGMILVAQPVIMAIFSPIAGRLSDKIQARHLSSLGMLLCATGLAMFSMLKENSSIGYIIFVLVWVGFGFALFSSPNMSSIMGSVDKQRLGFASGTAATMRVLGQMTSMTIITLFFASLFNGNTIELVDNAVFMKVIRYGFGSFSVLCFIGIFFSFKRGTGLRENVI